MYRWDSCWSLIILMFCKYGEYKEIMQCNSRLSKMSSHIKLWSCIILRKIYDTGCGFHELSVAFVTCFLFVCLPFFFSFHFPPFLFLSRSLVPLCLILLRLEGVGKHFLNIAKCKVEIFWKILAQDGFC